MWRFLNNIPRALKNYHGPRASVGVYVESDEKDQDTILKEEKESQNCVVQTKSENSFCPFKNANIRGTTILWRLVGLKNHKHTPVAANEQHEEDRTNQEQQEDCWWGPYKNDPWAFLKGSNGILEALAAGSSIIWNPYRKKKGQKSDLVYRVLFSICVKEPAFIKNQNEALPKLPTFVGQTLLAIKDASGSEQDRLINETKSESLDAALKEFEHICTDYTSQNESLLGIMAADKGDMSDAVKHFHTACAMGNKTACFNMGLCYEMGTGVSRNLEKAKHYYELAAVKGHSQAMYNLSLLYLNEDGLQEGREDRRKGLEWMEMAARTGLAKAQNHMGVYYMEEMSDAKKAVKYFKASASQHDSEAQYFLALCHEHGLGVEVNECWAAHLYSLAASAGHDEAICNLARFNEHGLGGIPCDAVAANELYSRAAKLGNKEAEERLEELRNLDKGKAKITVLDHIEDKQKASMTQPPSSPVTRPLNSSSSSPNLRQYGLSLFHLVNQRIWEFYQTCADNRHQLLFNLGGQVRFQIGGNNDEVNDNDDVPAVNPASIEKPAILQYKKCSSFHKSNTTPDLSSAVMCNT